MNVRELIESIVMIVCGIFLVSPIFNTYYHIEALAFMEAIPETVISHLAFGLLPIILYFIIMVFVEKK